MTSIAFEQGKLTADHDVSTNSGANILKRLAHWFKSMQAARLAHALQSLPDDQLVRINLKRCDIPKRAHWLIFEE